MEHLHDSVQSRRLACFTVAAVAIAALVPGAANATQDDESPSTTHPRTERASGQSWKEMTGGFWAAGSSRDSFEEQVAAVNQSKPARRKTIRGLKKMRRRAKNGHDLALVGTGGPSSDLASVKRALRALRSGATVRDIPDHYEIRGHAWNDRRSWTFKTVFEAKFCDRGGCEMTDRIDVRWDFDPGRHGNRTLFNARYFPKSGAFEDIYARWKIYCNQEQCAKRWVGKGGKQDGSGSGIRTLHHENTAGEHVTDLIRLRAHFKPRDEVLTDRARTKRAKCRKGSRRHCVYPKD